MRLKTLSGRSCYKNTAKCLIKWEGKSLSKMQASVKKFLKRYWEGYKVYEEFPVFGTQMHLDFFNATRMVAVEVNGDQHREFTPYFHNDSRVKYWEQMKRDRRKAEWCELNNIKLVEIYEEDFPLTREFFKKQGVDLV